MPGKCRVLLVDDEEDACLVLGDVLEGEGCEVVTACDPALAVDVGRSQVFDLVILDIRMPGMSGIDVLRRIRCRGHGEIVMLTGYVDDDVAREATEAGAAAVLHKPVDLMALLERVSRLRSGAG